MCHMHLVLDQFHYIPFPCQLQKHLFHCQSFICLMLRLLRCLESFKFQDSLLDHRSPKAVLRIKGPPVHCWDITKPLPAKTRIGFGRVGYTKLASITCCVPAERPPELPSRRARLFVCTLSSSSVHLCASVLVVHYSPCLPSAGL